MAIGHGKDLIFKLDNSSNVLKTLTAYTKKVDFPLEIELNDVTPGGGVGHKWFRGLQVLTMTVTFNMDDAADGPWDILKDFMSDTSTRTFEFYPKGGATPKATGECVVKSLTASGDALAPDELVMVAELDGAVTLT
ncbi:MAG: hypothetical protein Q8O55_11415 [Dehalococcoidales bacterium]|nr:hypothetical protein [Dehalococcoidales bacterium]